MGQRAQNTQERILQEAEKLILTKGFSSTSIDEIVDKSSITKSGFFYHFAGKNELAKALIERYLQQDDQIFNGLFERADSLSDDPLQQLLIFLKLFSEMMANLEATHPGCLVVSFTYESHQLDDSLMELMQTGVSAWETMIETRLQQIVKRYPPNTPTDLKDLANMFTATVEGGILLSRLYQTNQHLVQQIMLYRQYLKMLFED